MNPPWDYLDLGINHRLTHRAYSLSCAAKRANPDPAILVQPPVDETCFKHFFYSVSSPIIDLTLGAKRKVSPRLSQRNFFS